MRGQGDNMEHLKRCICVFAILSIAHGDVRDGFFVGGRFGVSSESPSYKQNTPTSAGATRSVSATELSQDAKQDIQNALQLLKNLNGSLVRAAGSNQDLNSLSSISLSSLGSMRALQANIANILQHLQAAIDNSTNNGQNQAIMSQYRTIVNELQTLQTQITQEVNNYNQELNSQKQNYDTKHAAYQKAEQEYQGKVQAYNTARDSVTNIINNAPSMTCGFNAGCSSNQLTTFLNDTAALVHDLQILAPLNPKFSQNNPQQNYNNAYSSGYNQAVSVQTLENLAGYSVNSATNYFTNLLQQLGMYPNLQTQTNLNLSNLISLAAWFNHQADIIEALKYSNPTQFSNYMQGLLNNYQGVFQDLTINAPNLNDAVPPATQALGNGPQFSLSNQFNFPYQNFAPQIQATYHQLNAIPNIALPHTIQIKPSLAPLAKGINQSSSLFSNISYNVDLLAGYQYFFSGHFGFSFHVSVGYGYIHSPIFNSLSFFKHLQDIKINLGANLIYDFNTPTDYKSPVYYGVFAGVQGGNTNFVLNTNNRALWRASYNLGLDLGLRFQFSSNIIKVGVDIPLVPYKVNWQTDLGSFQLNRSAKDIGFFITYEKLIF